MVLIRLCAASKLVTTKLMEQLTGLAGVPAGTWPLASRMVVSPGAMGVPAALVRVPKQLLLTAGPCKLMPAGRSSAKLALIANTGSLLVITITKVLVAEGSMVEGEKLLLAKIVA